LNSSELLENCIRILILPIDGNFSPSRRKCVENIDSFIIKRKNRFIFIGKDENKITDLRNVIDFLFLYIGSSHLY